MTVYIYILWGSPCSLCGSREREDHYVPAIRGSLDHGERALTALHVLPCLAGSRDPRPAYLTGWVPGTLPVGANPVRNISVTATGSRHDAIVTPQ